MKHGATFGLNTTLIKAHAFATFTAAYEMMPTYAPVLLDGRLNPLPHTLVVRPAGTGANLETLVADLDSLEETALVQLDTAWLERLRAILELARRVVDVTTVLLSFAVIAIIGNTIRLEIGNRREGHQDGDDAESPQ